MGRWERKGTFKSVLKYVIQIRSNYCGTKIVPGLHNFGVHKQQQNSIVVWALRSTAWSSYKGVSKICTIVSAGQVLESFWQAKRLKTDYCCFAQHQLLVLWTANDTVEILN